MRLIRSLPPLLRHPLTAEEALATLRRRLDRRSADFVELVQKTVYDNPHSPYRALLRFAGCEAGDVRRLVEHDGVEGALGQLFRVGVFLTVEELKGRQPVVRGSLSFPITTDDLFNPLDSADLSVRTSGTTGQATTVPVGLNALRDVAVDQCLALYARGGLGWPQAIWGVPGSSAMRVVLRHAAFGAPPARWYSEVDPAAAGVHPRYVWSARVMRWAGLLAGVTLPRPEYVPVDDPDPILRWLTQVRKRGEVPHLRIFASAGVRLCQAATERGVDMSGVQFTLHGEPTTAARLEALERVGARGIPGYATVEAGSPIGYGCLDTEAPDEVHVHTSSFAVIQPGDSDIPAGLTHRALLLTTLLPTTPMILLNVSTGDEAELGDRHCGCALEGLGWSKHLHTIRSFEKLTAGGMTFLDTDVVSILEDLLPSRFGGAATDYQLVEGENRDGKPALRLLVDPSVGQIDEAELSNVFLEAIGHGSGVERIMGLNWRGSGVLTVERRPPYLSRTGKVLHVHHEVSSAPPG